MSIELLIRAKTNEPHSGLDERHFWKRGDIVVVKEVPANWGREEDPDVNGLGEWWIITITGVALIHPRVAKFLESGLVGGDGIRRRRRWFLNHANALLPDAARTTLLTTGRLTVTAVQANNFIDAILEER